MATAALQLVYNHRESLRGTVMLSIAFHVLLFLGAVGYTVLGGRLGGGWGRGWGSGGSVRMNAVASLPGVPLPAPLLVTRNTVAVQTPGLYRTEPQPQPPPLEKAQEIPKFKEAVKAEKAERINKRIQKEPLITPENAVPFGLGGRPSMSYSQFANSAGEGGLNLGEGGFGDRFSWYVAVVRNRISSNWLLSTISSAILTAPRVYLTFEILRDGTVTNVEITQSSGIPEVDRSALRAVLASSPLGPLPRDYAGDRVAVQFYFDFRRR
jgi:TonB family protein